MDNPTKKRSDYIAWDDYFMATALLAAKRSKDPCTQVGACIIDEDKIIVGLGYNGFPTGCSDDEFPWSKNTTDMLDSKHTYVCHAELNAVLNTKTNNLKNCTIYVTLFPCSECAKVIIQLHIKNIIYLSDKHAHKPGVIASKRMLDTAGVKYTQFKPSRDQIVIDLTNADSQQSNQSPPSPIKINSNGNTSGIRNWRRVIIKKLNFLQMFSK